MNRDSKGRFCKADSETPELPIILPEPEVGDIMYAVYGGGDREGTLPPHETIKAYRVEELLPGGAPVCFTNKYRPEEPMYLENFWTAKKEAIDGTTAIQLAVQASMSRDYKLLRRSRAYFEQDFQVPPNMTDPKFQIGEEVYGVAVRDGIHLGIWGAKGVIIGIQFEYAPACGGLRAGWNYEIYSDDKDAETGQLESDVHWLHESEVYREQEEAISEFLHQARRIHALYGKIINKLRNLKPEDLKPEN